mmetsp:Transcript_8039/g.22928  ORF Transcript_8039/g.22928 Transcript_8039/m.22928 type:complete len:525 (+) Transcript_8039:129-1703(+)
MVTVQKSKINNRDNVKPFSRSSLAMTVALCFAVLLWNDMRYRTWLIDNELDDLEQDKGKILQWKGAKRPKEAVEHQIAAFNSAGVHLQQIVESTKTMNDIDSSVANDSQNKKTKKKKLWESIPPTPIALMDTKDPFIQKRHICIQGIREKHERSFQEVIGANVSYILLVDPAYHKNVGDHMLTRAEMDLMQRKDGWPFPPDECNYVQAIEHVLPNCSKVIVQPPQNGKNDPSSTKMALWHAGGNWGDLYGAIHKNRAPSFKLLLEHGYKIVGLPQSLHFGSTDAKDQDAQLIKENVELGLGLQTEAGLSLDSKDGIDLAKSRLSFMWRELESFEEAEKLYPYATNLAVPDIAFQLGPFAPIRKHPDKLVDIILFLRKDKESTVKKLRRNADAIQGLLPRPELTYKVVDWNDRLDIFGTHGDPYFTDTAIELLSLGKVVVCDRLHAAILSYLVGIPFVYIDQVTGKATKVLRVAFDGLDGCDEGQEALWAKADSLQDALHQAVAMMDKYGLGYGDHRSGPIATFT